MSPSSPLTKQQEAVLYDRLIRLGDMMGDGLHHESDGKWISKEYAQTAKALGIIPPKNRGPAIKAIDSAMVRRCSEVPCGRCGGALNQVRSGARLASCTSCGCRWKLLKAAK